MIHKQTIQISSGTAPPLVVNSSAQVYNLNASYLEGYPASAFAPASHVHAGEAITSGRVSTARLADAGTPLYRNFLTGGTAEKGAWRSLETADLPWLTDFTAGFLTNVDDASEARALIGAAASVHTHTVSEVSGAAAVGSSTVPFLPYWTASGVLGVSPVRVNSAALGHIGVVGTITCNDLDVNYVGGSAFRGAVYNLIKAKVLGSASVTVTPNDGAQTVTLTATPGSSLPAVPAPDAPYVMVREGGVLSWRPLVGDGVGIS